MPGGSGATLERDVIGGAGVAGAGEAALPAVRADRTRARGAACSYDNLKRGAVTPTASVCQRAHAIVEEVCLCPDCLRARNRHVASGMWIDFEHIGESDEIVALRDQAS